MQMQKLLSSKETHRVRKGKETQMQKLSSSSSMISFLIFVVQMIQVKCLNINHSTVPAVFAFGDSLVDPGNNNQIPTLAKSNFPPYGRDFVAHKPTGRFSNGKLATDVIASQLGVKELLPAYLDPQLKPQDLLTGVSFGSAGTGFDTLTAETWSVLSIWDQLKLFGEYTEKLKAIAGENRAAKVISKSVFVVCAGNNDVVNTYFGGFLRKSQYDFPSYANFLVQTASSFIQELYQLGARRITVLGLPPLGCLPSQRTIAGGIRKDCVAMYNEASTEFNSKLSAEIGVLGLKFPSLLIVYVDLYSPVFDVIQNHRQYGFEEVSRGCCLEYSILCNDFTPLTCRNVSEFVFWDSFHPTQRVYELVVPRMVDKYIPLIL